MRKIVLSIKPCVVEKILTGRKTVEYRKQIPRDDTVRHVVVYSSYPVKRVVAEFSLGGYIFGTPEWLWRQTSRIGGITKGVYDKYFEGKEIAYAYLIENLRVFEQPKLLAEYGLEKGPQDFCYVDECSLDAI